MVENQFEGWVPEFGNGHHKFIIKSMKEYYEVREKYERSISQKRPDPEMRKKCVFLKKNIKNLIKEDKKARFLQNRALKEG